MRIRFGYVAHALSLWEATPSRTMTFASYKKLKEEESLEKLKALTKVNLENTVRALHYNIAHGIPLYRFSSSIVPLATHPEAAWDYLSPFRDLYKEIGQLVKRHKLRTSFHPNQFTLFTSDKLHVTANAIKDMEYHYSLLEAMDLHKSSYINIHIGGAYGDKETTLNRFRQNLKELPEIIKKQMTLENDDKTYTASETLQVCEEEQIPMMFDYHHFIANHTDEENLGDLLTRFLNTWNHTEVPPKIHLSSPKSDKQYRSHADFVDVDFIKPLLDAVKEKGEPVDVMIEAKAKDQALLRVVEELAAIRGVKRVAGGVIEY